MGKMRLSFALVCLAAVAYAQSPAPVITSTTPNAIDAGGPAFTLTVNGDGFILASQITGLEGATTTYVSLNQLSVSVPASVPPTRFAAIAEKVSYVPCTIPCVPM